MSVLKQLTHGASKVTLSYELNNVLLQVCAQITKQMILELLALQLKKTFSHLNCAGFNIVLHFLKDQ